MQRFPPSYLENAVLGIRKNVVQKRISIHYNNREGWQTVQNAMKGVVNDMNVKEAVRTLLFKEKVAGYNQLYTVWGEHLNSERVLTEYPRPQLKRENYTILNGYWNYSISSDAMMPESYDGKILVPFSPESILSGVNKQLKPSELLWYERILEFQEKRLGYRCLLHFGAVDQCCEVYMNHLKIGEHTGGYLPFSFDITRYIETGTNLLTVKVWDKSETSYHSRGKQKLNRGGMFYTAQSGIWQTVWLEWVPETYIEKVRITPLVDDKEIKVEIKMNDDFREEDAGNMIFRADIYDQEQMIGTMVSRMPFMRIPMESFNYWFPETPTLYNIVLTAGEDRVESYFAMRKIEIKKDNNNVPRIYLNNEPYFQNGLLDQGYWPDGLYTAPSDEAMIFDITKAKELGFNMLRKHIKIEPLRWYYHCDRIGMLVWQDMVNGGGEYNQLLVGYLPTIFPWIASLINDGHYRIFGRKDPAGRQEWKNECETTVSHLYNSPSVVAWVPFNEGWGQFDAKNAYRRIKEMDPTRLVDHASGWYDQKCGDFVSIHNYFHPLKMKMKNRPYILSEFGGYACYVPEHSFSRQIYGYRIYLTAKELNQALQNLMNHDVKELAVHGLSAAVYTQISDVEDEVNGLYTYDRKICKVDKVNILEEINPKAAKDIST